MRLFQIAVLSCLAGSCAASAYAQYGLYGSPEMLRLPATNAAAADVSSEPASYPGIPRPVTPAAPPAQTTYQPYYQPDRPSAATQQPYQPSPQYSSAQSTLRDSTPHAQPAALATAAYPQGSAQTTPTPAAPRPLGAAAMQAPSVASPMASAQASYGGNDGNCGACRGDVCGGASNDCGLWYGSLSTLVLGRSEGRRLWTSYVSDHNVDQLTNTQDIHLPWAWGGEVQVGRRFCACGEPWAIQGTFWATQSMNGYSSTINSTIAPFTVSTPLEVSDLQFNGETAQDWFDGAEEHRLWRRDQFYNVEINLLRMQTACGCNSPWEAGWSAGVRYFRFDEKLTFGSLRNGGAWGELDNEAYLNDNVTNNLFGFQVGFDLAYRFADCARLFIAPKIGVYDNSMNQNFQTYLGNGTVGSTPYGPFPVTANRNDVAFLSQIDLGVDWQFSRNWSAQLGYRIIAVTGVAQADDQFPQYIVDVPEIQHIDNHSSLVLHGAFVGVTYNF